MSLLKCINLEILHVARASQNMVALQRSLQDFGHKVQMEMDSGRREEMKKKQAEYSREFESLKQRVEDRKRQALLGTGRTQTSTSNPNLSSSFNGNPSNVANIGGVGASTSATDLSGLTPGQLRDREQGSLHRSIQMVDDYYNMGVSSLQSLRKQHTALKEAQKRMLDIANTLGLSQTVIKWIERRSVEDLYMFYGGVTVTILVIIGYFWFFR